MTGSGGRLQGRPCEHGYCVIARAVMTNGECRSPIFPKVGIKHFFGGGCSRDTYRGKRVPDPAAEKEAVGSEASGRGAGFP